MTSGKMIGTETAKGTMRCLMAGMAAAVLIYAAPDAAETGPVMKEAILAVSGMICSSCSAMVEKTLKKLPGVAAADADFKADRVSVRYDATRVTPRQMAEALRQAGYRTRWPEPQAPPLRARKR